MSLHSTYWLFPAVLVAGCSGGADAPGGNSRAIACGPLGQPPAQSCRLEVEDRGGELHLTVRQPEGGFRRFVWPRGGALAALDGAEPLRTVPLSGAGVEARIGGWAYRIERRGAQP